MPTQGSCSVVGEPVSLININLGIEPDATGRENIRLRAAMMGMSAKQIAEEYDEISEFSGLAIFSKCRSEYIPQECNYVSRSQHRVEISPKY